MHTPLETASRFAREELRPVALQYDETEEYPLELLHKAAALGLTCYDLPAEYGGGGRQPPRSLRGDRGAHVGRHPDRLGDRAGRLLRRADPRARHRGTEAALAAAAVRRRPARVLCAITEPGAGSDSAAIETTARRVDGGYVLDGHKNFIGNAPIADVCVVFATVEPGARSKGITAFVVERGDAGFVRGARLPKMGSRCFPAGELLLRGLLRPRRPPARRRRARDSRGLMGVLRRARVQLAAQLARHRACRARARRRATRRSARRSASRSTSSRRCPSGSPTRS